MARNSISEVTILLNDEFQKPTSQAGGGLAEISTKNSRIMSPIFARPLADEKAVLPNPHPLRANNGKAENLRTIEERGVRPDSKQLVDMRIFSDEEGKMNLVEGAVSNVDGEISTQIRVTAIPNSNDVVPVRNQILEIDL